MHIIKLTLKNKIYLLSIVAMLFLLSMAWISYLDLNSLLRNFNDFRKTSLLAQENVSTTKKVDALQYSVQKFINTASKDSLNDVYKNYEELKAILEANRNAHNLGKKESLVFMDNHLDKYFDTFMILEQQVTGRQAIKYKKIELSRKIDLLIKKYFNNKESSLDQKLKYELSNEIHNAERDAVFYFETLDSKYINSSKESFNNSMAILKVLTNNNINITALHDLKENLALYYKIVLKEIQLTKSYQFLVNVVMAAEAYEIHYHANIISKNAQTLLDDIDKNINETIYNTDKKLIISALIFFVLLVSVSFFITRTIIKPLTSLTKAFSGITKGELNIEIPEYDINDEIGNLTESAKVFISQRRENKIFKEFNQKLKELNYKLQEKEKLLDQNIIISSTDLNGKITYISEAFSKTTGYKKNELIGNSHSILKHPDTNPDLFRQLWKTISSDKTWTGEIKNLRKDGGYYWNLQSIYPVYDNFGKKIGYTSIGQDVTDKKRVEELSITDALTSIYNRRHFNELFPKIIHSAKRDNNLVSFLIMDIDFFKQYNDTYGHQMGDTTLIKLAECLKKSLRRADDYCFRLGGEEFGIIFNTDAKDKAVLFANDVRQNVESMQIEHSASSASTYVTVSIGLVCKRANEIDSSDAMYKEADDLLYKAKELGRNRVVS